MGYKEAIREYIQDNMGEILEFFLDNVKVVARGNVVLDIDKRQIRVEKSYLAIVDKRKGKDMFKKHIPIEINLKIPSQIKTGLEFKMEFIK